MRPTLPLFLWAIELFSCASSRLANIAELKSSLVARHSLAVAAPRRVVSVKGVSLAVHDTDPEGTKPAIVCLHAIGHGGSDFAAFESAFEGRFRVVSLDWPGHGDSGSDAQPASAKRYAELLEGLLDAMAIDRPILFGNSIGGAAALSLAQRQPERVRALVLCNPGGLDPGGFFARLYIDHLVGHFRRGVAGEAGYRAWFSDYYADILLGPEAAARRTAIVAAAYASAPRLAEAWESFAQAEADLRPGLQSLRMPVFVGWAMKDGLVQWDRNRAAVESMKAVKVVPFAHSGHSPFLEESRAFNAALAPFLERFLQPSAPTHE